MADRVANNNKHPFIQPSVYESFHEAGVHGGFSRPPTVEEQEQIVEDGNLPFQRDSREYPGELGSGDAVDILFNDPDAADPELRSLYIDGFIQAMGYTLPLDENGKPEGLIPEDIDDGVDFGNEQGANPETDGVKRLKGEFAAWLDGQDREEKIENTDLGEVGPDENGNYALSFSRVRGYGGSRNFPNLEDRKDWRWRKNQRTAEKRTPSMDTRQAAQPMDRQAFENESDPVYDHVAELYRIWQDPDAKVGYIVNADPNNDRIVFVSKNVADPPRPTRKIPEDIARKIVSKKETDEWPKQLSISVNDFNYALKKAGIDMKLSRPKTDADKDSVMGVLKHLKIGTGVFRGEAFIREDRRKPREEKKHEEAGRESVYKLKIREDVLGLKSPRVQRDFDTLVSIWRNGRVFEITLGVKRGDLLYLEAVEQNGAGGRSAAVSFRDFCEVFDGVEYTDKGLRFGKGGPDINGAVTRENKSLASLTLGKVEIDGARLNKSFLTNFVETP